MVQLVSPTAKPVPESITVVPGSGPSGGEPVGGEGEVIVRAGLTVKGGFDSDGSP